MDTEDRDALFARLLKLDWSPTGNAQYGAVDGDWTWRLSSVRRSGGDYWRLTATGPPPPGASKWVLRDTRSIDYPQSFGDRIEQMCEPQVRAALMARAAKFVGSQL